MRTDADVVYDVAPVSSYESHPYDDLLALVLLEQGPFRRLVLF